MASQWKTRHLQRINCTRKFQEEIFQVLKKKLFLCGMLAAISSDSIVWLVTCLFLFHGVWMFSGVEVVTGLSLCFFMLHFFFRLVWSEFSHWNYYHGGKNKNGLFFSSTFTDSWVNNKKLMWEHRILFKYSCSKGMAKAFYVRNLKIVGLDSSHP